MLFNHYFSNTYRNMDAKVTPGNFKKFLSSRSFAFFKPFIDNSTMLALEYSVISTQLAISLPNKLLQAQYLEQIISAFMLAELLIYINTYIDFPAELVQKLKKDHTIYRALLLKHGYNISPLAETQEENVNLTFSQNIRGATNTLLSVRALVARIRRMFVALTLLPPIHDLQKFCYIVSKIDDVANPIITHFTWIVYLPRFILNIYLLIKHLILPTPEGQFSYYLRLKTQFQQRGFELINDSIGLINSLLSTFVLTGTLLAPLALHLTIILYLVDVVLVIIRNVIEYKRLNNLLQQYTAIYVRMQKNKTLPENSPILAYIARIKERKVYEYRQGILRLINASALFLAISLSSPLLLNPIFTVISAILMLAITCLVICITQQLEKSNPSRSFNPKIFWSTMTTEPRPNTEPRQSGSGQITDPIAQTPFNLFKPSP